MKKGSRTRWQVLRHSCHVPSPFSGNDTVIEATKGTFTLPSDLLTVSMPVELSLPATQYTFRIHW